MGCCHAMRSQIEAAIERIGSWIQWWVRLDTPLVETSVSLRLEPEGWTSKNFDR